MGSATTWQLARAGVQVIGIDRHHPPHAHGSTHGDTRITRLATAEGPQYVPLVRRSHELWREIEAETGAELLHQVGALMISVPDSPFMATVRALADRFAIDHERLGARRLREQFPMFTVPDDAEGYLEPEGGWVAPEPAVAAQLTLARAEGAQLRLGETVQSWSADGAGVSVITDAGTITAERLVLCAGPWLPSLLGGLHAMFSVHRQLLFWFGIDHGHASLAELPAWMWDIGEHHSGAGHLRGFYGFPAIDGPHGGLKLATEQYLTHHAPDDRQHPATAAQTAEMHDTFVAGRLPWLSPAPVRTVSCLYTCTRDSHFVIDHHPEHPQVTVVSPCSGHGFKHSAAIGEAAAALALDQAPEIDLAPFAIDRLL
jgi:sarcosine oxidase